MGYKVEEVKAWKLYCPEPDCEFTEINDDKAKGKDWMRLHEQLIHGSKHYRGQ